MRQQKFSDSDDSDGPEEVGRHDLQPGSDDAADSEQPSSSGQDSEDDSESEAALEEREQALEQQLADIPFEVLEKLHQDGKGPTPAAARAAAIAAKQNVFHRETKNRPQELSSKRPVSRFREVIQVPKQ